MDAQGATILVVGRIAGNYGVRGWVRVQSYTEPAERILDYSPWLVGAEGNRREVKVVAGRHQGPGLVVQLAGVDDREAARALLGAEIVIQRAQLPPAAPGEYYWADLTGLQVVNREGVVLGVVDHLFETGANDVLVVVGERQHLLPYVRGEVVLDIDLGTRVIRVDWDPEF